MIDIDSLEALARDVAAIGRPVAANPADILALIAEVRALREDKARLDSGCILTHERNEFGEEHFCERRGNNLRLMIDNAMALAQRDATKEVA